ncbi:MAG: IclR family transcriptional regulator [Lachnospiraceae bacterium]|nr:IclR family transcriptional regulator [Lachnospiraceae bacterium]
MNADGVIVQSVDRALTIIQCFTGSQEELGISELSDQMGLHRSTIYGLVNTLTVGGYLEQNPYNRKYRLGMKLFELGNLVGSRINLREIALPYCKKLADDYGQGVHLAVKSDDEMIYIDKVDVPGMAVAFSYIGKRAKMYCTGVGKAMLAFLPEADILAYLQRNPLEQITPHTIADRDRLFEELKQIRERAYAIDNEEAELGLKCVAAPIFDHTGHPVAALSSSGSAGLMNESLIDHIKEDVLAYTQAISVRLGYAPSK